MVELFSGAVIITLGGVVSGGVDVGELIASQRRSATPVSVPSVANKTRRTCWPADKVMLLPVTVW